MRTVVQPSRATRIVAFVRRSRSHAGQHRIGERPQLGFDLRSRSKRRSVFGG